MGLAAQMPHQLAKAALVVTTVVALAAHMAAAGMVMVAVAASAQSVLSGPAQLARSPQPAQAIFNQEQT